MSLSKWIHHLLEPHCEECKAERDEAKVCMSCESLRMQIEYLNQERKELLDTIVKLTQSKAEEPRQPIDYQNLTPRAIPWRVRQQMLEAEDRKKAELLRQQAVTAEQARRKSDPLAKTDIIAEPAKDVSGPSGGVVINLPDRSTQQSVEELEKELGVD